MRSQFAAEHSKRTGHKVYIETASDIMERSAKPRPKTKAEIEQIVLNVESRSSIRPHIIGPDHTCDCRCPRCWAEFQSKWVSGEANQ